MDGIAERGIKFTLKVATDQSAKAELSKLSNDIGALQAKSAAATQAASAAFKAASQERPDASTLSAKETNDRIEKLLSDRAVIYEANNAKLALLDAKRLEAAQAFATQWQAITDSIANGEEIDMAFAQGVVEQLGQAALEAKAEYDEFQDSLTSKAAKEAEKRTDKELQALKKRQAFHVSEAKKMVDRELAEIERGVRQEVEMRRQAELAAKRAHDANMENYDRLSQKAKNSSRQLLTQFGEINESVMRFARGLAMVGLSGEEDIAKMTKSLVKLQGYFDFFSGGVKTLTKLNEMYRHMTTAIQAATAAQTALNLAQGLDGSGKVIRDPLNKDKTKRGGGNAIGAVADVGKEVVSGGLDVLLLNALTGGKGAAAATSFGGKIAMAIASKAGPIGIVIGSALATYQGVKAMVTGDFRAYEGDANPFMWSKRRDLRNAEAETKRLGGKENLEDLSKAVVETPRQKADREANKKIDELIASRTKAEAELRKSANERMRATLEEQKPLEARVTIAAELAKQYKAIQRNEKNAHQEVINWQKARLANEKLITQEKSDAAKQSLAAAKSELDAVIKRQQALRDGVMSAAERFATLDPEKQQEILETQKRLRRGDKTLTTEELQAARGFGGQTDERISRTLQSRAFGSGFGAFAQESFKEIAQLEQTKKKLEVEVKQKLDFSVRIESDYDALAKKIAIEIDKQQQAENVKLVATVNKEIAKLKEGINQRTFGRTIGVTPP